MTFKQKLVVGLAGAAIVGKCTSEVRSDPKLFSRELTTERRAQLDAALVREAKMRGVVGDLVLSSDKFFTQHPDLSAEQVASDLTEAADRVGVYLQEGRIRDSNTRLFKAAFHEGKQPGHADDYILLNDADEPVAGILIHEALHGTYGAHQGIAPPFTRQLFDPSTPKVGQWINEKKDIPYLVSNHYSAVEGPFTFLDMIHDSKFSAYVPEVGKFLEKLATYPQDQWVSAWTGFLYEHDIFGKNLEEVGVTQTEFKLAIDKHPEYYEYFNELAVQENEEWQEAHREVKESLDVRKRLGGDRTPVR
jgi:hypothetical protein